MDSRGRGDEQWAASYANVAISGRKTPVILLALVLMLAGAGSACGRKVDESLTRAVEAWDAGDYKMAAEEYERYLAQYPAGDKAPDAHFQLANIYYFKFQRYDQARAHYSYVVERSPGYSNVQLARERLAEGLGEMGRSYEATAEYEKHNPPSREGRRQIGLAVAK